MSLGFEASNLDHTARFAEMFREAGDHEGAALQELVGAEEIAHVAFGAHWFRELSGELTFERWRHSLAGAALTDGDAWQAAVARSARARWTRGDVPG